MSRYRITATYTERIVLYTDGNFEHAESRMDDIYSGILSEEKNEILIFGKEKPSFKIEALVDEKEDTWEPVEPF